MPPLPARFEAGSADDTAFTSRSSHVSGYVATRDLPILTPMSTQGVFRVIPHSEHTIRAGTIDVVTETPPYSNQAQHSATPDHSIGDLLRSLRRSSSGRVLAGVLSGLGRQVGIDPVVLRIVTAVLALFGGVGVLLYALAWLLIPADDEAGSVADQALGRVEPRGNHAGALAVGLGIVVLVSASIIITGSVFTVLLLALAGGGAYVLLRNSLDNEGRSAVRRHPSQSEYVDTLESDYPRSWPPSEIDTSDATFSAPESDDEPTPNPAPKPDEPTAHAWHATETRTDGPASSPGDGTGWPEGPDWGPYRPAWSPEPVVAEAPAKDPKRRSPLGVITLCAALVVLGIMAVNDATWASIPVALYFAVALAIIGAGLVIGSWFGRSRGLIALGVVLSLALLPVTWADEWASPSGSFSQTFTSIEQLPEDTVEFGAGDVTFDLSRLDVPAGDEAPLSVEMGAGNLNIYVPSDVALDVDLSMGAGSAVIRGERTGGLGTDLTRRFAGTDPDAGTIVLRIEIGAADVKVIDQDPPAIPEPRQSPDVLERSGAR